MILWTLAHQDPLSMAFSRPEYWSGLGSLSLLQGIFPTQGSNPSLLHCRQTLYHLNHQGSQAVKIHKENPAHSLEVEIISTERSQLQVLSATGKLCPGNHRVEVKGRSLSQIHRGSAGASGKASQRELASWRILDIGWTSKETGVMEAEGTESVRP